MMTKVERTNVAEAPTVPTVQLVPTAPGQYDLALAGRRAGVLIRTQSGEWLSALRAISKNGQEISEDGTHRSALDANDQLRRWAPEGRTEDWTGTGPTITTQKAFQPAEGDPEIHFGFVPSGGRLTCGMNRYHSTLVTETPRWVTCPDCSSEVARFGSATVITQLKSPR